MIFAGVSVPTHVAVLRVLTVLLLSTSLRPVLATQPGKRSVEFVCMCFVPFYIFGYLLCSMLVSCQALVVSTQRLVL